MTQTIKYKFTRIAAIIFFTTIATTVTAQIKQSELAAKAEKRMTSNKNIGMAYTVSADGNTATFKLTNSGTAIKGGERFTIELPVITGYRYDLSNLQKDNGFESSARSFEMVITGDYNTGDVLSFHCPVVAVSTPLTRSPTLQFVKK